MLDAKPVGLMNARQAEEGRARAARARRAANAPKREPYRTLSEPYVKAQRRYTEQPQACKCEQKAWSNREGTCIRCGKRLEVWL